jgi:hypothetical protein
VGIAGMIALYGGWQILDWPAMISRPTGGL